MLAAFVCLDASRDLEIDHAEWEELLRFLVHNETKVGQCNALWHLLDADGSGSLDLDEFFTMCEVLQYMLQRPMPLPPAGSFLTTRLLVAQLASSQIQVEELAVAQINELAVFLMAPRLSLFRAWTRFRLFAHERLMVTTIVASTTFALLAALVVSVDMSATVVTSTSTDPAQAE